MKIKTSLAFGLVLFLFSLSAARARADEPVPEELPRELQISGTGAKLTDGNDNWKGLGLRLLWQPKPRVHYAFELDAANRFSQTGLFGSGGVTLDYSDDWYQSFSVGGSSAGDFWPRFGASSMIFKKWFESRRLITGLGVDYNSYTFGSSDLGFVGEVIYYPDLPFVIEGGHRANWSSPGKIASHRDFAAITLGYGTPRNLVLHYDTGTEAYQLVSDASIVSNFSSSLVSATASSKIPGMRWSVSLGYEHYWNPFYKRDAVTLGLAVPF